MFPGSECVSRTLEPDRGGHASRSGVSGLVPPRAPAQCSQMDAEPTGRLFQSSIAPSDYRPAYFCPRRSILASPGDLILDPAPNSSSPELNFSVATSASSLHPQLSTSSRVLYAVHGEKWPLSTPVDISSGQLSQPTQHETTLTGGSFGTFDGGCTAMGLFSFFSRKPGARNRAGSLKAQSYDSVASGPLPTKGEHTLSATCFGTLSTYTAQSSMASPHISAAPFPAGAPPSASPGRPWRRPQKTSQQRLPPESLDARRRASRGRAQPRVPVRRAPPSAVPALS